MGAYPINDGDKYPEDPGYSEFNLDAGYKINTHLKVQLSIYNLFNTKADSSAYYYTSRIPGEPLGGVTGIQVHPLEPISGVLKVTALVMTLVANTSCALIGPPHRNRFSRQPGAWPHSNRTVL